LKEYSDLEIEELDKYLQNGTNYEIYERLIGDGTYCDSNGKWLPEEWCKDLFTPLEFIRLLDQQKSFIEQNKQKPLFVAKTLRELKLSDLQFEFLYDYILPYFAVDRQKDENIDLCCREITKHQETLEVYEDEEDDEDKTILTSEQKDEFEEVLEHLETLEVYKEKIAYLIKKKAHYDQNKVGFTLDWGGDEPDFSGKCQIEIDKLKELHELEKSANHIPDDLKKHKDLTLDRSVLFVEYILRHLKTSCKNTDKAKAISFLTGYSEQKIAQSFSRLEKEKSEIKEKTEISDKILKDSNIVRKYLQILGLEEIEKEMNKDLELDFD
jgi:hypothetical protein